VRHDDGVRILEWFVGTCIAVFDEPTGHDLPVDRRARHDESAGDTRQRLGSRL